MPGIRNMTVEQLPATILSILDDTGSIRKFLVEFDVIT
jgi:hypothetical protein